MDGEATDFLHMQIHRQTDLHFSELFLMHAESNLQQDWERLKTWEKRENWDKTEKEAKQTNWKRGLMERENAIKAIKSILNVSS